MREGTRAEFAGDIALVFEIWKDDVLIGHSKLELGDAPMGVAFGDFLETEKFASLRPQAERLDDYSRRWRKNLILKGSNGDTIECHAGIAIIEYGPPIKCDAIQVSCLGIGYPLYEELFPHHVKAYEESFEG